jgi:dTMP kinase
VGCRLSGRFITFEGPEGVGKSTQVRLLTEALQASGVGALATREPGGAAGAEQIRTLLVTGRTDRWHPLTETLLHFAARQEHLEATVRPALAAGTWVVCDRFADSTWAYQCFGQGVPEATVQALRHLVVGPTEPDLTIILDLPVEVGLSRAGRRAGDETRYEAMGLDLHRRVSDGFREIARRHPARCVLLDAGGRIDEVQAAVRNAVRDRLGAFG